MMYFLCVLVWCKIMGQSGGIVGHGNVGML